MQNRNQNPYRSGCSVLIDTYRCLMQNELNKRVEAVLEVLIDTYRCLMQNKAQFGIAKLEVS